MMQPVRILILVCTPAVLLLGQAGVSRGETERIRAELSQLSSDVAALKSDPKKSDLERQKLEEEIEKLKAEVNALKNTTVGAGMAIPWLQAVGLGSLIGGLLVLIAGKSLSSVQRSKLQQDIQFAGEDHEIQRQKLQQDMQASKEEQELQFKKLRQEMAISRSEHSLKLFEALGSQDPRIRIGAASELGQRVRELNEQLKFADLSEAERAADERERQNIVRVLIAVSKHEDSRELQKHIADLIVELLGARAADLSRSPLAEYDFQGAKLANAWWKRVDAREVDFYEAALPMAGLADSNLSKAVFKNSDLSGATLRGAVAVEANFERANLSGIKAAGAIFTRAVLTEANLEGANLEGADFSGANLNGALLKGAFLKGAILPFGFEAPQTGTLADGT